VIPLLLFLLLVALLFGLAAAIHLLWIVAIVALVLWLVGFLFRPRGGRWSYS
jgi:membrane-bound ClpP family serine protease